MIIVEITGGLGNQMFQYAFGRAQAERLGVDLVLDTTSFIRYRLHHGFQLSKVFNIQAREATSHELKDLLGWRILAFAGGGWIRSIALRLPGKRLVREPHFHYCAEVTDALPGSYFTGYWQSERYFAHVGETIRREFTFKHPPSAENSRILDHIHGCNSVSIHVRRGDFVTNGRTNAYHGSCSGDYYSNAVRIIQQRVENAAFFVFSDEIGWAQANLSVPRPCTFVEHNIGQNSFEDMRLMSVCKHHIIANSSFSWWGAWLNSGPEKLVVAPKNWFLAKLKTEDLLPETWIKI